MNKPLTVLIIPLAVITFLFIAWTVTEPSACEHQYIENTAVDIIERNNGTMESGRFIQILEAETGINHNPLGGCVATTITDSDRIIVYDSGQTSTEKVEVIN